MTAQPYNSGPSVSAINWTMVGIAVALMVQFAGAVSFAARAEAQITELKDSTKPLRDGDLVRIQTDVSWIRERLEKDERR